MEQSYYQLKKLPYRVVREKNDHYFPILNPQLIRRNYSFRQDKIIQQSALLDLGEVVLLSKVHIQPSHPKIVKIEIGNVVDNRREWIVIEKETEIVGGKIRIINIGSLPCRFLKITYLKGCPIMDYSTVELYGMEPRHIHKILSEDTIDLLYNQTYTFLYS